MAKAKSTTPRRSRSVKRKLAEVESTFNQGANSGPMFEKIKTFFQNPAVKTIAGTIFSTAAATIVSRIGQKYPNLSNVLKESFSSFESSMGFNQGQQRSSDEQNDRMAS